MGSKRRCGLLMHVAASILLLAGPLVPEAVGESAQAVWTARHDGPPANASDIPVATVVDGQGNIYVTGTASNRTGLTPYNYSYANSYSYVMTVKYDTAGNELWTARYGDQETEPNNAAAALAVDHDGNVYVTGTSHGDYATVKYDSAGNELWVARYDSPGILSADSAAALAVDHDGNVYITGTGETRFTNDDYATVKYDAAGNTLWVAHYDGPDQSRDSPQAMVLDSAGNVYVTGISHGEPNMDDYATIKYDGAGNELWVARYDGPAHQRDVGKALAVDSDGSVYVTGWSQGEGTSGDYATIKYNGAGNELWVARYDGPAHEQDVGEALAVNSDGSVYVTGYSHGVNDKDCFTIKYDGAGNALWAARYDGPAHQRDAGKALAVDSDGNVYVTGSSQGDNDTYYDYATIKYDPVGNELWVDTYDGAGHGLDSPRSLALDPSGNVVITGRVVMDTEDLFYDDDNDYGTIKYDTNGNRIWEAFRNNLGPYPDFARKGIVDQDGNVYVTGSNSTVKYDALGAKMWADPVGGTSLALDNSGNLYVAQTQKGTVKYGPDGDLLWSRADGGRSLALDPLGQPCVVGYEERPGTGQDFKTLKYDSHGNMLWTAWYNGPANDTDSSDRIIIDSAGNVFITGQSKGVPDSPYCDYATIKYDPAGNELWVARYDASSDDYDRPTALAVDEVGHVYVTGSSMGDYATVKYDSEGNEIWTVRYDSDYHMSDSPLAIAVDSSENVYVTGNSGHYVYESGLPEFCDYATIKYDSEGNQLWEARYHGEHSSNWSMNVVSDMAVDASGNVYVAGSTLLLASYSNAYATLKYNTNGQLLWKALYDGPQAEAERAVSLAQDALGNIYVTGSIQRTDTDYDYLTIKYIQVPAWSPAAVLPRKTPESTFGSLSLALGWLLSLSMPLFALVLWKRARRSKQGTRAEA